MQVQDYLPFFQKLLLHYYQFTLENSTYAICLTVSVWLLMAIFYSLRIGFLNRRNRNNIKTLIETQSSLADAQQQIQHLSEEIAANNEQIEQIKTDKESEVQRSTARQARIEWLANQLSTSIAALTTNADLSEQFSPTADGLEVEDLWQRYSAASKQLNERLATERKSNNELQQAYSVKMAKLAEKNLQLHTMQASLDSQRQQLATLELKVEEHKTLLAQQQENAQQRLSEAEIKHQSDLTRLATLEQQALEGSQAKQQQLQLQEKLNAQSAVIAQLEQVKPVENLSTQPQAVVAASEPTQAEPVQEPIVSLVIKRVPAIVAAEMPKHPPSKVVEKKSGGIASKLKNMFSGAKKQIDKLDGKLVDQNNPLPQPEEIIQSKQFDHEPAIQIIEPQPVTLVTEPIESKTEENINPFAAKAWTNDATPTVDENQHKEIPAEIEPQPVEVSSNIREVDTAQKAPGKFKNLLGKFKRKS
jgi:hypothetical protein